MDVPHSPLGESRGGRQGSVHSSLSHGCGGGGGGLQRYDRHDTGSSLGENSGISPITSNLQTLTGAHSQSWDPTVIASGAQVTSAATPTVDGVEKDHIAGMGGAAAGSDHIGTAGEVGAVVEITMQLSQHTHSKPHTHYAREQSGHVQYGREESGASMLSNSSAGWSTEAGSACVGGVAGVGKWGNGSHSSHPSHAQDCGGGLPPLQPLTYNVEPPPQAQMEEDNGSGIDLGGRIPPLQPVTYNVARPVQPVQTNPPGTHTAVRNNQVSLLQSLEPAQHAQHHSAPKDRQRSPIQQLGHDQLQLDAAQYAQQRQMCEHYQQQEKQVHDIFLHRYISKHI